VSGYSYQWQIQTTAGGPFTNLSGGTGTTFTTGTLGAYRVIVNAGSCIDTSGIASVTRLVVQGGTISTTATLPVCPGETVGLIQGTSVPGSDVGSITFAWESNVNNAGWTTIPNVNSASYSLGGINQPTAIRRKAMDRCGNSAYSNVLNITIVAQLMPGSITPLSQTVVRGAPVATLTGSTPASGGSGNYTYQWYSEMFGRTSYYKPIPGATSANYNPGPLQETFYFKRRVIDVRCGTSAESNPVVVNVSNAILNAGAFTIFSQCFFKGDRASDITQSEPIRGGTPPYVLQWQSSTDNVNWTDIPGANAAKYSPGFLTATTYFRIKATDAANQVAYSSVEQITMLETPLTPGTIAAASNVACLGSAPPPINSTGAPTGFAGLEYQWQYKSVTGTNNAWVTIPGQRHESLSPSPITEKTWYRRVAVDYCGTSSRLAYSNEVVLDVRPAIIAGDIEPTSQMVRINQTPKPLNNITPPSGGTGSYQITWESAPLAVGPFTTVSSATGLSYQPSPVTQSMYYRRKVSDLGCLASNFTYIVEVYLNTAPPVTGGNLGGSTCVFPGGRPSVIITGSTPPANGTPPYTYSWETRVGISGTWTAIAGATSETYHPPVISQTTQYRRMVTDKWGEFAYSDPFTVNYVTTAMNPGTIAASGPAVCSGGTPSMINQVTAATGGGEFVGYQWQMKISGGAWADISGATNSSYQPGSITQKTYFRRGAIDKCSEVRRTVYSNEVMIDLAIVTRFYAGLIDGPFITCSGTAAGGIRSVLAACAGNATVKYQWESFQSGSWVAIAGATGLTYSTGIISSNMIYRRKAYTDCGNVGYSNSVEIYVYPPIEPGVIGTETQTVCGSNGTAEMIKLLTNCHYTDGTVTYQWQSATSMNGPWADIAGATTNQYQPTASTMNMYYRLMVKSTRCNMSAASNVATVMVDASCRPAGTVGSRTNTTDMKVYPNPVTGNSIDVKLVTKGTVNVSLMDSEGRILPVSISRTGSGLMRVTSSSKAIPSGMYLLTVKDEAGNHTSKIMVQ
jgi:hypothetical protein